MMMSPLEAGATVRAIIDAIDRAHTERMRPVAVVLSPQGVLAVTHYLESLGQVSNGYVDLSQLRGVPIRVDEQQTEPWIVVTGPRVGHP